jgi:hypothetical protein
MTAGKGSLWGFARCGFHGRVACADSGLQEWLTEPG